VPVLTHDNGYRVGPGRPRGIRCEIEGDASLAAFWQTAGYITTRKVDVTNLKPASIQRDRVFPELLDALDSRGIAEFDLRDTPDLLPPLVVAALFAGRPVRIGGVAHARDKESDRLSVLAREFGRIGARIQVTDDGVFVEPSPLAGGVDLDPHNDHRMAMAFAIAGLRVPGTGILDPGCVSKSYPGFFADLEAFR
jgi:3-phosphoshikimate 1-carboxyvinyltransferase